MLNAISTEYLEEYCQEIAIAAEVKDAAKQFNISPVMETKLQQAIVESDSFLNLISNILVDQIKGQVIDVGDSGLTTGRVKDGRFSAELSQSGNTYELIETDSGAHINWITLTIWANSGTKGQWSKLMNNAITRSFALDKLRIGFHGTAATADTTNPSTNKLGQDVNKGWLAIAKEKASEQVLSAATLDPSAQTPDSYKNLDSLVNDLVNTTIHEVHAEDADLVVLIGRDLVSAEQHRLLEAADVPTEHKAAQQLAKTIAGKRAYIPPFFPKNMVWVTNLKNLQILTQKGTQWRKSGNVEDRKRYETSYLRMEGYAIGNLHKFAAIEAVTVVDPAPAA
ncbi:oxidoreductase [Vibrio sp. B183]|uniref:phage major capsid protein, P2 family n=1 Tax=Vibrio sp. B183 TaxID=1526762 RepID=UPI00050435A4|nr:phage major capsid protein, P2 family [Vibrio sp. B183]KFI13308.1 oxidoreductase [Vibrio sp. B183]